MRHESGDRGPQHHRREGSAVGDRDRVPAPPPGVGGRDEERERDGGAPRDRIHPDRVEMEQPHLWTARGEGDGRQPSHDHERAAEQPRGQDEQRRGGGLFRTPHVEREREGSQRDHEDEVPPPLHQQRVRVHPDHRDRERRRDVAHHLVWHCGADRGPRHATEAVREVLTGDGRHEVAGPQARVRRRGDVHDDAGCQPRGPVQAQEAPVVGGVQSRRRPENPEHHEGDRDDGRRPPRWRGFGWRGLLRTWGDHVSSSRLAATAYRVGESGERSGPLRPRARMGP